MTRSRPHEDAQVITPSTRKRFWTDAKVVASGEGFSVRLDDHEIRTPSKFDFSVPTSNLANLISAEWLAQSDRVDPATMPMTRRANAAIDKVTLQHRDVADMLAHYGTSDLLCHRADHPSELIRRQTTAWDPLLAWAATKFSAPLNVTRGVMPVQQPAESLDNLRREVRSIAPFPLSGFHDLVTLSGSLVIGLAVIHEYLSTESLWQISRLDEIWQEEQWGKDEDAGRKTAQKYQDFLDAEAFYRACF